MEINARVHIRPYLRFTTKMERQVTPTAIRNSLNDTAFDVKKSTVNEVFPRVFAVRDNRFAAAAFRVKKASRSNLRASVFDRLGRGNLREHINGGTRRARGRHVAVPTDPVKARRGARGVPKNLRPTAALAKPNTFVATVNGQKVIMQRPKRGKPKVLYVLERRVRIKKRFPFEKNGRSIVRRRFPFHFDREFRIGKAKAERETRR